MRFQRSFFLQLTSLGLVLVASVFGEGRGRTRKPDQKFPLETAYTIRDVISYIDGVWVSMDYHSPEQPILQTTCLLRRYGPDGSTQREVRIGEGLCRQLKQSAQGYLALIVRRKGDELFSDLWISSQDGTTWTDVGKLPCDALGVTRLIDGSILVWDWAHLFKSTDEGKTWASLPLAFSGSGKTTLSRESLITELPNGKVILGTGVYEAPRKNTVRIGIYSPGLAFQPSISIDGILTGTALQPDGSILILVHENGESDRDPSEVLYLMESPSSSTPSLSVINRESSMLPLELIPNGSRSFVFSSIWKMPTSFPSAFSNKIYSVEKGPDGKWITREEQPIESFDPQLLSISPNGDAWVYVSTMHEHGIYLIKRGK